MKKKIIVWECGGNGGAINSSDCSKGTISSAQDQRLLSSLLQVEGICLRWTEYSANNYFNWL